VRHLEEEVEATAGRSTYERFILEDHELEPEE
jgi:hypothetical protein